MKVIEFFTTKMIPVSQIDLRANARTDYDEARMATLMSSIKENGLLQSPGVRQVGSRYEICFGNRRFKALEKLGATEIPCAILPDGITDDDADFIGLIENNERHNISTVDFARLLMILKGRGFTVAEMAVRLNMGQVKIKEILSAITSGQKDFIASIDISQKPKKERNKISPYVMDQCARARKRGKINQKQEVMILTLAKYDRRFKSNRVRDYIAQAAAGAKDPLLLVQENFNISLRGVISAKENERLERKFIRTRQYRSLNGLCLAILNGKESANISIRGKRKNE